MIRMFLSPVLSTCMLGVLFQLTLIAKEHVQQKVLYQTACRQSRFNECERAGCTLPFHSPAIISESWCFVPEQLVLLSMLCLQMLRNTAGLWKHRHGQQGDAKPQVLSSYGGRPASRSFLKVGLLHYSPAVTSHLTNT